MFHAWQFLKLRVLWRFALDSFLHILRRLTVSYKFPGASCLTVSEKSSGASRLTVSDEFPGASRLKVSYALSGASRLTVSYKFSGASRLTIFYTFSGASRLTRRSAPAAAKVRFLPTSDTLVNFLSPRWKVNFKSLCPQVQILKVVIQWCLKFIYAGSVVWLRYSWKEMVFIVDLFSVFPIFRW